MPAFLITGLKWIGTSLLYPLAQWFIRELLIPFVKVTIVKVIDYYKMKKKLKEIQEQANAKVDEYVKNPTDDNFANLP